MAAQKLRILYLTHNSDRGESAMMIGVRDAGMDVRMQVIEGIKKGAQSGHILSAGLVNDETEVEFILILDVETKTEAYNLLQKSKNVKNGFFSVMIYSYFAPKGLAFQK